MPLWIAAKFLGTAIGLSPPVAIINNGVPFEEDVMRNGSSKRIASFLILPIVLAIVATTAADSDDGDNTGPPSWVIDRSASTLQFSATVAQPNGDEKWTFVAEVGWWTADIRFDPERPEDALLDVGIDMTSIGTGEGSFDQEMLGKAWLDAKGFTQATYRVRGFERTGDDVYTAEGSLTLRGMEQIVPLAFELKSDGSKTQAVGTAEVQRLDFGIGKSAGPGLASTSVAVSFDISASTDAGR